VEMGGDSKGHPPGRDPGLVRIPVTASGLWGSWAGLAPLWALMSLSGKLVTPENQVK
jgi:hypothetical protein